ncbi:MAG: hypothetical protein DRJ42_02745 [Deltaproteobacteria bacterium]|nr:MAG: hypothetical protein DRJ42_02745 [Deltaproteobacteria bacterium]
MTTRTSTFVLFVSFLTAIGLLVGPACGGDDNEVCVIGAVDACEAGLVCEEVVGGMPACFAPIELRGRVFDASTDVGIADATIVALDVNGAARSDVARSGIDGTYSLPIAVPRAEDGTFNSESIKLRVDADGYQTFPTAPRSALPIEVSESAAVDIEGVRVIMTATTDVALIGLPAGGGGGRIEGFIMHPDPSGVLVVADQGGNAISTAISDRGGNFILFNVPAGTTQVEGYRAGINIAPATVEASGVLDTVSLVGTSDGLGTVTGSVNIVNAPGGLLTSVILVVDSTFDETAIRGEAPAGLRAEMVSSAFSIEGVPPGRYAVLAAFENDQLVRDPDESIAGTDIVRIDVAGDLDIADSFKVTEALAVVSPGADTIEVITGDPTFVWADDSSEDGYELRVYDSFGEIVHENTMIPGVSGSSDVSYTWTGAALEVGLVYQFRAWSFREPPSGTRTFISATEDLRGVFAVE